MANSPTKVDPFLTAVVKIEIEDQQMSIHFLKAGNCGRTNSRGHRHVETAVHGGCERVLSQGGGGADVVSSSLDISS